MGELCPYLSDESPLLLAALCALLPGPPGGCSQCRAVSCLQPLFSTSLRLLVVNNKKENN